MSGSVVGRSVPSLAFERSLLAGGAVSVACVDEAGRGALAGPVCVAAVLVTADTSDPPEPVADSKQLSPARRVELAGVVRSWVPHAAALASAGEVDRLGLSRALQLAAARALTALPVVPSVVLLDGNHDYLSRSGQLDLFDATVFPPVVTRARADADCAGVAAASILAKTVRDAEMVQLARQCPGYGWELNKGYGSPEHVAELRRVGPSGFHRRSWSLPGVP